MILRFLPALLLTLAPALLQAGTLLDAEGQPSLAAAVESTDDGTVIIRLKEDGAVTAQQVVDKIAGQGDVPAKVRITERGIEVRSDKGAEAVLGLLKTLDVTATGGDPWMEIASLDFGGEEKTAGSNIRARKLATNAVALEDFKDEPGTFQASVIDVKRGPFPTVYLQLGLEKVMLKGGMPAAEGVMLAQPDIPVGKSGSPSFQDEASVTNTSAYYLQPEDVIVARFTGVKSENGVGWWTITDIRRVQGMKPDDPKPHSFALINQARAHGNITEEQAVEYKVYALYDQDKLPAELRSTTPNRGASLLLRAIRQNWSDYSAELKKNIQPYLKLLKLPE